MVGDSDKFIEVFRDEEDGLTPLALLKEQARDGRDSPTSSPHIGLQATSTVGWQESFRPTSKRCWLPYGSVTRGGESAQALQQGPALLGREDGARLIQDEKRCLLLS